MKKFNKLYPFEVFTFNINFIVFYFNKINRKITLKI